MARNTSRGRFVLSLAITLPIAVLAGYVILEFFIHYVMGFLTGSSALDDLMVGHAYLIASFLLGLILTVLNWRKVDELIARYGIPGIVTADDSNPADSKKTAVPKPDVSISLFVTVKNRDKFEQRKVFAGRFTIERLRETLQDKGKTKVILTAANGSKLVIARADQYALSHDLDPNSLFIKLIRNGKVVFHLETISGEQGSYVSDSERRKATCNFRLVHISTGGPQIGTLQFFGTEKNMRKLFYA